MKARQRVQSWPEERGRPVHGKQQQNQDRTNTSHRHPIALKLLFLSEF
jgi:hypothetical protein